MVNSLLRAIFDKVPPSWSHLPLVALQYARDWKEIKASREKTDKYTRDLEKTELLTKDQKDFLKSLKKCSVYWSGHTAAQFIASYTSGSELCCLKRKCQKEIASDDVILVCCVKNDLQRVQCVLGHHRKIGVVHFVFVDNMSTDGTTEWLLQQDVDVYQTTERYHAGVKAAWVRRIWDIYGYNRWYLVVDSDELFSYPGMEKHSIQELIRYAEENEIERVRSFLLDMYSDRPLFVGDANEDIESVYRFFDTETYYRTRDYMGIMIRGGPRKRLFESKQDYANPLTKYPLLFVKHEDLWQDHEPYPFGKNFKSECITVLRHFKFIYGDKEKYKVIVREGNYFKGSFEYKTYLEKIEEDDSIGFYYEGSAEYTDSYSLLKIPFIRSVFRDT